METQDTLTTILSINFPKDHLAPYTMERLKDKIERVIKNEISQYFYENYQKNPTTQEYHEYFDMIKEKINCRISNYDLGIYE